VPLIYCPLCEAHCGLEVDLEGGRALAVRGAVSDPDTHGFVCPKGAALAEVHNHPERLRTPLLRAADGRQRAVGWAEALGFIAERLEAVRERHGAQAVAVHVGRAGVDADFTDFARLFCFQFGSPNFSHAGSHCFMSKRMANVLTYGTLTVPDYRRSDCMLLWGYNPSASCPALASLIRRRKEEGAALVVVDPYCTPPARLADLHLQLRPGSDGALALGLLNVVLEEGLYDAAFTETWAVGLDELRASAAAYVPDVVEELTWVPADRVREAARLYAGAASACMAQGLAAELHVGGLQGLRGVAALQALTGNLDIPGGGLLRPRSPLAGVGAGKAKPAADPIGADTLPLYVLLSDAAQANLYADAVLEDRPYPLRALVVTCSNPPLTWPGSPRVARALEALDLLVAVDHFRTATTRRAHVVLPAASPLERWEVFDRFEFSTEPRLLVSARAVSPQGPLSDWEVFRRVAQAVGLGERWPWVDEEAALDFRLSRLGVTARQVADMPEGLRYRDPAYRTYERQGFQTPSRKVELFSPRMAEAGYSGVPVFLEPTESPFARPELMEEFPLVLGTGARHIAYVSSRGRNLASLRRLAPKPVVEVHPETAAALRLVEGAPVRLTTPRGSITVTVALSSALDPRVIRALHGWEEANINEITEYAASACDPVTGFPPWRALLARVEPV